MRLQIIHETRYDYVPVVHQAQHMAYLQPRNTVCQQLCHYQLQVLPTPATLQASTDVFGNTRQYVALEQAHAQLQVIARSEVLTYGARNAASHLSWEATRAHLTWQSGAPWDAAGAFALPTLLTGHTDELLAFAQPCFAAGQALLHSARLLMQHIHASLRYESHSTQVHTPAGQALAQGRGVCQDFAHIMIACLRARGLAARYVSGYLLTQPAPGQPRLVGSDASHAWVSVYLPDLATDPQNTPWWDFDPTNLRDGCGAPGEDYVALAWGRDYEDVAPLRGVIRGGDQHRLQVAVTTRPLDAIGLPQPG